MSRTVSAGSISSQTSNSNVPLTPLGQTIGTPTKNVLQRFNSMSSVATSDEETASKSNNPMDSFFDWPAHDDELLMSTYQAHIDNPMVAPFAGRLPPSGIIHRVAKDTTKQAKQLGRHFPHTLNATRKRLLLLCGRQNSEPGSPAPVTFGQKLDLGDSPGATNGMNSTVNGIGQPHVGTQIPSTPVSMNRNVDFDFFEPPQFAHNRSDSPLERLSGINSNVSSWLFNTETVATAHTTNNEEIYPPTPASPLVGQGSYPQRMHLGTQSSPASGHPGSLANHILIAPKFLRAAIPLASPFREKMHDSSLSSSSSPIKPPPPLSISRVDSPQSDGSPTLNYTSERKRDSLKAKRGMREKR